MNTYEKAVDARKRHGEVCGKHPGWTAKGGPYDYQKC